MATINRQEVIKELTTGCRIDTAIEAAPSELGKTVVPTYVANPRPRLIQLEDTTANDSNKSFTVPAGKQWKVLWGFVNLVSTATVGNRRIRLLINDPDGDFLYIADADSTQAASLTERYMFMPGISNAVEDVGSIHLIPIPRETILPQNFAFNILDGATVDAAADDMTIRLMVLEEDMPPEL